MELSPLQSKHTSFETDSIQNRKCLGGVSKARSVKIKILSISVPFKNKPNYGFVINPLSTLSASRTFSPSVLACPYGQHAAVLTLGVALPVSKFLRRCSYDSVWAETKGTQRFTFLHVPRWCRASKFRSEKKKNWKHFTIHWTRLEVLIERGPCE